MKLKFWGTRGSLPRSLDQSDLAGVIERAVRLAKNQGINTLDGFVKACKEGTLGQPSTYGGRTSCTEIISQERSFIVDMGSGLSDLGYQPQSKDSPKEYTIFLTHMHWDHIMGMPFFLPIYTPRTKITIYHVHKNAPQAVQTLFNGVNFPVKWEDLGATIVFRQIKIYQSVDLGDGLEATAFVLDHPGGCFGFRFEDRQHSVAVGVDGEYKRVSEEELGKDLKYYQDLDVLVFDAQYEIDELASRFDWGHCSPPIGVDLALREGIKHLIFTHHDPRGSEDRIHGMLSSAQAHLDKNLASHKKIWEKRNQPQGPLLYSAFDGLNFEWP